MRYLFGLLCLWFVLLVPAARGADAPWKYDSSSIYAYTTLYQYPAGANAAAQPLSVPADKVLVGLYVNLTPSFDDTHASITFKPEDIVLTSGTEKLTPIGQLRRSGIVDSTINYVITRPADWGQGAKATRSLSFTLVYLVAANQTKLSLDIAVPGKPVTKPCTLGKPLAAQPVIMMNDDRRDWALGVHAITGPDGKEIRNPAGQFILTHFTWYATSSNDVMDSHGDVLLNPANFSLRLGTAPEPNIAIVPLYGMLDDTGRLIAADKVTPITTKPYLARRANGDSPMPPPPAEMVRDTTLVFAVPQVPDSVNVRYLNWGISSPRVTPPFTLVKAEGQIDDAAPAPLASDPHKPQLFGEKLTVPSGQVLVTVTAHMLPEYFAKSFFTVNVENIQLLDGSTPIAPVGQWGYYAAFCKPGGFWLSDQFAPEKYAEKPTPLTANMAYLVPADKKNLTLRVLNQSVPVTMLPKHEKMDMNDIFTFRITSAKVVDSVPTENGGTYKNEAGKLLLVACEWSTKQRNDLMRGKPNVQFPHAWMNLKYGADGKVAPCLAELNGKNAWGTRGDGSSCNISTGGGVAAGFKNTNTFIFSVAGDVGAFELTCFGFTMAKGTAGK